MNFYAWFMAMMFAPVGSIVLWGGFWSVLVPMLFNGWIWTGYGEWVCPIFIIVFLVVFFGFPAVAIAERIGRSGRYR